MADSPRYGALAELVDRRGSALTRYAYLYTGDVAAAQDLVQDALVKVFIRIRSGLEPDALEAYVRSAITTVYIDGHRRRRQWSDVQHLLAQATVDPGPDVETPDRLDLLAALSSLAPQERAAVVLRYFEDLTVPRVAERMAISDGSVKRYLSNAVRKLEQRLGPLRPPLDGHDVVVLDQTSRTGRS